jgi:hypothetical protein
MVWNRRAAKDKRNPGKNNPREESVISNKPEHPALVSSRRSSPRRRPGGGRVPGRMPIRCA